MTLPTQFDVDHIGLKHRLANGGIIHVTCTSWERIDLNQVHHAIRLLRDEPRAKSYLTRIDPRELAERVVRIAGVPVTVGAVYVAAIWLGIIVHLNGALGLRSTTLKREAIAARAPKRGRGRPRKAA